MTGTYENPAIGEKNEKGDPKIVELVKGFNALLNSENKFPGTSLAAAAEITRAQLKAESKPFTWYTPKVIATEESRTNTEFGTLTTPDEITGVVVPTNGLLTVSVDLAFKSSVASAGRWALFIGSEQEKSNGVVKEVSTSGTNFTVASGVEEWVSPGTTGSRVSVHRELFLAAGTYAISVRFRATSGSVTAKERKLWAAVLGY